MQGKFKQVREGRWPTAGQGWCQRPPQQAPGPPMLAGCLAVPRRPTARSTDRVGPRRRHQPGLHGLRRRRPQCGCAPGSAASARPLRESPPPECGWPPVPSDEDQVGACRVQQAWVGCLAHRVYLRCRKELVDSGGRGRGDRPAYYDVLVCSVPSPQVNIQHGIWLVVPAVTGTSASLFGRQPPFKMSCASFRLIRGIPGLFIVASRLPRPEQFKHKPKKNAAFV